MSVCQEVARLCNANGTSHWGVVTNAAFGPSISDSELTALFEAKSIRFHLLRAGAEMSVTDVRNGDFIPASELRDNLYARLDEPAEGQVRTRRFLLAGFEHYTLDEQSRFITLSRGMCNKPLKDSVQFIILGAWNSYKLQVHFEKYFKDVYSFAPDDNKIHRERRCGEAAVREMFGMKASLPIPQDFFGDACVRLLREVTGGDVLLLDYVFDRLARNAPYEPLERQLEEAIEGLVESGEIADGLERRAAKLDDTAWRHLAAILQRQVIRATRKDPVVEDLHLAGFVMLEAAPGYNENYVTIASSILERLLRKWWSKLAPQALKVYPGGDLAGPYLAINTAAHELVARIEQRLRHLIVLELSQDPAIPWEQPLARLNTKAHDEHDDLLEFRALLAEIHAGRIGTADPAAPEASIKHAARKIPIMESARDWRERQRRTTSLHLARNGLINFFKLDEVGSVLLNDRQEIYKNFISRFYPDKKELAVFLEQFINIRAAVAHNQAITLSTLRSLEQMRLDIEKHLSSVLLEHS